MVFFFSVVLNFDIRFVWVLALISMIEEYFHVFWNVRANSIEAGANRIVVSLDLNIRAL